MPSPNFPAVRTCLAAVLFLFGMGLNGLWGQDQQFIRQADGYYADAQYAAALQLYRQAQAGTAKDPGVRLRYARCLIEGQDPRPAIAILQSLVSERKPDPEVFRWLGRAYMDLADYPHALNRFKTYLRNTRDNEPARQALKDDIVRCAYGMRMQTADALAFVENAGPEINTAYDEYDVLNSPTVIDRIYFHSNRTASGTLIRHSLDSDIFTTSILNGRWSEPHRLPPHINSSGREQASGFSADGQILYYIRTTKSGTFMQTDTFTESGNDPKQGFFDLPFTDLEENGDLHLFQDSICLFASRRPGGFGGYDLYIAVRRNGRWIPPANLGPAVNTSFDERFPFLTRNGRTLYFSSDRLEGAGGYDIWETNFSDEKETWQVPVNLGFPVNGPGNETAFVLAPDGMSGFVTSDRIGGQGGRDIYRVIFKQQVVAHQQISAVPTFFHALEQKGEAPASVMPAEPVVEKKEYYLSHLFLESQGDVLSPQNLKKLDVLANLLQIYPNISVELNGFESSAGQRMYNLYFSVREAEKAAEYLIQKGIASNRILVKGYGSSFPILTGSTTAQSHALQQRLGRRIEITPLDFADEPVEIHVEKIQVPESIQHPAYRKWLDTRGGLHYAVQIAATTQMLQNADLESRDYLHIEYDRDKKFHKYLTGWAATYQEAEKERQAMQQMGFLQAFIVPFVDGRRLDSQQAFELTDRYPDLSAYLAARQK